MTASMSLSLMVTLTSVTNVNDPLVFCEAYNRTAHLKINDSLQMAPLKGIATFMPMKSICNKKTFVIMSEKVFFLH
jgi:hypothetical protein